MKKLVIISVLLCSFLLAPVFASAQTASTQTPLTQQLIQLFTKIITQLTQEIQQILTQHPATTTTQATPFHPNNRWLANISLTMILVFLFNIPVI